MEEEHKVVLQDRNLTLAERILTIRELVGERGDFDDPVGGSEKLYRQAARAIIDLLSEGWAEIQSRI